MAVESYQECIQKDPTNVEAFNRLVDCQLVTGAQKEQLLASLAFPPEDQWLRKIYLSKIKHLDESLPQMGDEEVRK